MTQTIETIKENRWRNGKQFITLMNIDALPAGISENVLICIGDKNVIVESISIQANVESLSWRIFAGAQFTDGSGTEVKPIKRNSAVEAETGTVTYLAPTITDDGQSFTEQPIKLIAQIFRNNNYFMEQDLISSDFIFIANTCYLIRLINTSADATNIQFTISTSNT